MEKEKLQASNSKVVPGFSLRSSESSSNYAKSSGNSYNGGNSRSTRSSTSGSTSIGGGSGTTGSGTTGSSSDNGINSSRNSIKSISIDLIGHLNGPVDIGLLKTGSVRFLSDLSSKQYYNAVSKVGGVRNGVFVYFFFVSFLYSRLQFFFIMLTLLFC